MRNNQLDLFTNEEQRVEWYQTVQLPTLPEDVTSDTRPEDLDLNWRESDLPERVRTKHVHRLHPYLGKFVPQLVEIFLRMYFKSGDTVYDPFCGSGTTLVEANASDINAIGCDISSFNCLLSKVKTQRYDLHLARNEVLDILQKTKATLQRDLFHESGYRVVGNTDNSYVLKWYAPQARQELLTYNSLISDYSYQDLLKVILSRSARSARLTTHFDLDFPKSPQTEPYQCYKHSRICAPTQEALGFLQRYSLDTIKRLEEFAVVQTSASVIILNGDSRYVQLPNQLSGIITSPPYVGLIDYHEQHRYAYEILGLEDRRGLEIGAAKQGSSRKAQREYQESIAQVFRHACESMVSGGRMVVVAGDKYNLYDEIARLCEVEVETVVHRHVNRRTGRRSGEFFESIFIWRKP